MIQLDDSGRLLPAAERCTDRPAVMRQAWRLAHQDAERAYRDWAAARPHRRGDAYIAYVAAADREAAAVDALQAVVRP